MCLSMKPCVKNSSTSMVDQKKMSPRSGKTTPSKKGSPEPTTRASRRRGRAQRASTRTFVEHNYNDHYNDPVTSHALDKFDFTKSPSTIASARGGNTMAFPEKLYHMLVASEQDGYEDIVSWQPHGRCFLINKKDRFVNEIMPRFFQQTKLTSFQRQLNLYGFIRLTAGRDRGGYYHEYFLRGRPDLCCFMVRTRVKGNGMKAASSPETEPNFYKMEHCYADGARVNRRASTASSDSLLPNVETSMSNDQIRAGDDEKSLDGAIAAQQLPPSFPSKPMFDLRNPPLVKPRVISPPPMTTLFSACHENLSKLLDAEMASFEREHCPTPPSTGDEVFFEGLKFHYLDHIDLDNADEIITETIAI